MRPPRRRRRGVAWPDPRATNPVVPSVSARPDRFGPAGGWVGPGTGPAAWPSGPPDSAAGLVSMKEWARRCRKILLRHGLSSLGVRNVRLVGAFGAWKNQVRGEGRGLAVLRRWAHSVPIVQLRFAFHHWRHLKRREITHRVLTRMQSSVALSALRRAYAHLVAAAAAAPLDRPTRHYLKTLQRRSVREWKDFVRRDKEQHAEVWWALAVRHHRHAICRRALELLQYAAVLQQEQRRVLEATERVCMRVQSAHMLARWWQAVERHRRCKARHQWLARVDGCRGGVWRCFWAWHVASGGDKSAAVRRALDHLRRRRLEGAWRVFARHWAGRRALRAVVGRAVAVGQGLAAARWPLGLARLVGLGPALVLTTRSALLRWRAATAAMGATSGGAAGETAEPAEAEELPSQEVVESGVEDVVAEPAATVRVGESLSQSQFLAQVERARLEAEEVLSAFSAGGGPGEGGETLPRGRTRGLSPTVRRGKGPTRPAAAPRRVRGAGLPGAGRRAGRHRGAGKFRRVGDTVCEALSSLLAEAREGIEAAKAREAEEAELRAQQLAEAATSRAQALHQPSVGSTSREAVYARVRARVARGGEEAAGASPAREPLSGSWPSSASTASEASSSSARRGVEARARQALDELLADVEANRRLRAEPSGPVRSPSSAASSLEGWRRRVERRRVVEGSLDSVWAAAVWAS